MLSVEQVEFYRREGYIVVPDLVDAAQLATARAIIARLLEGARGVASHTDVYDLEADHRPDMPRVRRLKLPHRIDPFFRELVESPAILAVLKALLGPSGVRLTGSKINMKPPGGGSGVEWHQDWAFYPHTNDDLLAVGVMLDDCTPENGAMLALPGSHKGPVYDHHVDGRFCGAIDADACAIDASRAVACTGRAGSVSFHHVRLLHASADNRSNRPRALLLYEVAAADAWPLLGIADFDEFNSRLLAGAPTNQPRLAEVPVRMPFPPALNQGSIYENQKLVKGRSFAAKAG